MHQVYTVVGSNFNVCLITTTVLSIAPGMVPGKTEQGQYGTLQYNEAKHTNHHLLKVMIAVPSAV